jgi:hypothetical protein
MSYFEGVKTGDRVWSFEFGWGEVTKIEGSFYPIFVEFNSVDKVSWYDYEGKKESRVKQTLFWDEVKFEIPKRPKIKLKEDKYLICLKENRVVTMFDYRGVKTGIGRNDRETAEKALKQIKKFAKLLALRDQECEDSRGYEFNESKNNWTIKKDLAEEYDKQFVTSVTDYYYFPDRVYFKTEEDAQKICDILNSGRFDLEGD